MWPRILRLINSLLNAYSFYSNPLRFIFSILAIIVFPYLIYIFWGSLIIIGLSGLGLYFLYRLVRRGFGFQRSTGI